MTIGTDRGLAVATRNGLSVNTFIEGLSDSGVAFSAGCRHICLGDGRLRITGWQGRVRAVAIRANSRIGCAFFIRSPVNALLV